MTVIVKDGRIVVSLPQFEIEQENDPATGLVWASTTAAQAWADQQLPQLEAAYALASRPAAPSREELQRRIAERLQEFTDRCEAEIETVKNTYPATERESWSRQVDQAQQYKAGNTVDVPLLAAIAAARSETIDALADKVLAKAASLETFAGTQIGKRHVCQRVLEAVDLGAPDALEQINAVTWPE